MQLLASRFTNNGFDEEGNLWNGTASWKVIEHGGPFMRMARSSTVTKAFVREMWPGNTGWGADVSRVGIH